MDFRAREFCVVLEVDDTGDGLENLANISRNGGHHSQILSHDLDIHGRTCRRAHRLGLKNYGRTRYVGVDRTQLIHEDVWVHRLVFNVHEVNRDASVMVGVAASCHTSASALDSDVRNPCLDELGLCPDRLFDAERHQAGLVDSSSVWKLDIDLELLRRCLGEEFHAELSHTEDDHRAEEGHDRCSDHEDTVIERPFKARAIEPVDPIVWKLEFVHLLTRIDLKESRADCRIDHKGHEERRHKGDDDGSRKISHELTHHAWPEEHREEGAHRSRGGGDHGPAYFFSTIHRGSDSVFAFRRVTVDILHDHDRIIHEHAEREHQAEENHHVQRVAKRADHHEADEHREWHADRHEKRVSRATHEEEEGRQHED